LEQNGFEKLRIAVHNTEGLQTRPVSAVAELASEFDCDLYIHREGMVYYNFLLDGRPYMNVRSILGFLSLGAALGDTLEFIATGSQARQALDALAKFLSQGKPGDKPREPLPLELRQPSPA
jgi:phosphotransferase system HPr (HPr) family protein